MCKENDELLHALISRGEYTEAIALLDEKIWKSAKSPENHIQRLYRTRAHLCLFCGCLQQARSDFDTIARLDAEAFRTRPHRLHADSDFVAIGATYWMEERKELALAFWRYVVSMHLQRRVDYTQAAVGVVPGLMLWFGAVYIRTRTISISCASSTRRRGPPALSCGEPTQTTGQARSWSSFWATLEKRNYLRLPKTKRILGTLPTIFAKPTSLWQFARGRFAATQHIRST